MARMITTMAPVEGRALKLRIGAALLCCLAASEGAGRQPASAAQDAPAEALFDSNLLRARRLYEDERWAEAEEVAKRLLDEAEASFGKESRQAYEALALLVDAIYKQPVPLHQLVPMAERALRLAQQIFGPDHPRYAASLNRLGSVRVQISDFQGAREPFERALKIYESHYGRVHHEVGLVLFYLGALSFETGDLGQARRLLEESLQIDEQLSGLEDPSLSSTLNHLSGVLAVSGDYTGAQRVLERSLAIFEKVHGPDDPEINGILQNLSNVHALIGQFEEAKRLQKRSIAVIEKAYGTKIIPAVHSYNNLAHTLSLAGEYEEAERAARHALTIYEALGPVDEPLFARALDTLVRILVARGKYSEARSTGERALAIFERVIGLEHPDTATLLGVMAGIEEKTGNLVRAKDLRQRALLAHRKVLGPKHPEVASDLLGLARTLWALHDIPGALHAALEAEEIGREHLRLTARSMAEGSALRFAAIRASGLDLTLSLLAAAPAESAAAAVWDSLIRSRAIILDEMAARHHKVTAVSRLAREVNAASERLARLVVTAGSGLPPDTYSRALERARREKENAERSLAEVSVEFSERLAREHVGLQEVVRSLPGGAALLAFTRYDPQGTRGAPAAKEEPGSATDPGRDAHRAIPVSALMAFIVSTADRTPRAVSLGEAAPIEALVSEWRKEVLRGASVDPGRRKEAEGRLREIGARLRERVWDPIAPHLRGAGRLFVVPDGALNLVNFAALPDAAQGYLIESGPLVHILSAERDLIPAPRRPERGTGLLALGSPDFDKTALASPVTRKERVPEDNPFRGELTSCADFGSLHFKPLPAAEREAREIVALFDGREAKHGVATLLTGEAASEEAFKDLSSGRRILHIATHGFFLGGQCPSLSMATRGVGGLTPRQPADSATPTQRVENPLLLSGLALAGANQRRLASNAREDGILTAEEIAALDLTGVEWTVLSACDTGVGELRSGEGVFGLRRALRVAGVGAVIMSLWPVEDESAGAWMKELYRGRLERSLGTAEAVREASLSVLRLRRETGSDSHPFFWGAFVAAGE